MSEENVVDFELKLKLVSIEMTCGHVIYVTKRFMEQRRADHESFWCTACRCGNAYPAPKTVTPPPPAKKTVGATIMHFIRSDGDG
jgi:hypothetical protein